MANVNIQNFSAELRDVRSGGISFEEVQSLAPQLRQDIDEAVEKAGAQGEDAYEIAKAAGEEANDLLSLNKHRFDEGFDFVQAQGWMKSFAVDRYKP